MTSDVSHFYGDDCDPPHTNLADENLAAEYERMARLYHEMPGTPDTSGGAPPDAESWLDRLRRLDREATPAPWYLNRSDVDAYAYVVNPAGHHEACDFRSEDVELNVTLRNALPEIIDAFELLAQSEVIGDPMRWTDWRERRRALLSKVSGNG